MWLRLFLLLLLSLGAPPSRADPASVVLITLDTTRADRMGFLGSQRGLTPALDALAGEGVAFERAYAQAPVTTVSHATILTGTYPWFHGVRHFGDPLPAGAPYLPDILHSRGYKTAAFVGALVLDAREGLAPGFDRGFDTYDAGFGVRLAGQDRYKTLERRAQDVVDRALAWLERAGPGPFFLWVHLYDPHDPYEPPAPFSARFPDAPYDGEIASTDRAVGRLVEALRARPLWDRTLVALCADHGESLGDHGEDTHGVFLYDASLHVPLLIKRPGGKSAGRRVSGRVGLVDLAPTVLEEIGLEIPPTVQGRSLRSALDGGHAEDRPSCGETAYPQRAFGWSPLRSLRVDRFLLVEGPRRELYDQAADPGARSNLGEERPQVADRIAAEMNRLCRAAPAPDPGATPGRVDADLAERLAALGYVGGFRPSATASAVDPKDKIGVANTLHSAIMAAESGDTARAVPLLERVVASEPGIPMAQLQLGVARVRQRRYAQALPPLRRAIELQPESPMAHYAIGACLLETGDPATAARHYEIAVRLRPGWADAHFLLGRTYARLDRNVDAIAALRAGLSVDPLHAHANLLLGRLLLAQGRPDEAVPFLRRAAERRETAEEARRVLSSMGSRPTG